MVPKKCHLLPRPPPLVVAAWWTHPPTHRDTHQLDLIIVTTYNLELTGHEHRGFHDGLRQQ